MRKILIRFGDLWLKGKNIKYFIDKLVEHVKLNMTGLSVKLERQHDRVYINYQLDDENEIIKRLETIPGLNSFSIVHFVENDLDKIVECAIDILNKEISTDGEKFKLESRRANKRFPLNSQEITKEIAPRIIKGLDKKIVVDVHNPSILLTVDVRNDYTYIYLENKKLMGGFPFSTAGKGLLMMSGGIDSPVAGFLAIKQGIEVELLHFESTPLTPLESVQKVIDLAEKMAAFYPNKEIKLHLVPFTNIHTEILDKVSDPYIITIMRRMMYRIAERFAKMNKIYCLINGESVGQVASQTLESMMVVENVTNLPIIRPLVTYDKEDIIKISRKIDAFNISIRPFNDCCSIYVPKHPVTRPNIASALIEEKNLDIDELLEDALKNINTITIKKDNSFTLMDYGFSLSEALIELKKV